MTQFYNEYDKAIESIIARVGSTIIIGIPLGLGKPVGFVNALYRYAEKNNLINLTILTGLTLSRPVLTTTLEKNFVDPILERTLGNYADLLYEEARVKQQLPKNIKVIEFFLSPGKYINNALVQQDYISSCYTNVVRDIANLSINVLAQQVSQSDNFSEKYSISCNTDLFFDTAEFLHTIKSQGKEIAIVAEVNTNLPFMLGDAVVKSDQFTEIIDTKKYHSLFAIPKPQLSIQDYLIGLYSSAMVKDDSCLQIGIGKLGDAIAASLILRHKNNTIYHDIINKLQVHKKFQDDVLPVESLKPFQQGLSASTEMLSDGYMYLHEEHILKKQVYDSVKLQTLLNEKKITEVITSDYLDILHANRAIHEKLTKKDFHFLKKFGILKSNIAYDAGNLHLPSGDIIPADLADVESKKKIMEFCLGSKLSSGKIIHAGFFLGSTDFYQYLNNLSVEESQKIEMTRISRTNQLYWSPQLSELQRLNARFINSTMMVTLEGGVISDGLANWQEVSGIGGQYDFANMAQKLMGARFIINCHSTRLERGKINSNILWNYQNITLPRNLRDIIITEYGIADCRSKTDADVIKAILNITDSRYQDKLLKIAKKYGKISSDYQIPLIFQNNYPESLYEILDEFKKNNLFPSYPFGSELTDDEQVIKNALLSLKNKSRMQLLLTFIKALFFTTNNKYQKYLSRMRLDSPKNLKTYFYKKLLAYLIFLQERRAKVVK